MEPPGLIGIGGEAAETGPATKSIRGGHGHARRDRAISTASVLVLAALWQLGAAMLPSSVMPSPVTVASALWQDMLLKDIWVDVAITIGRILVAFSLALTAALGLGFAMGLSRTAQRFFDVWIVCGITLPALVIMLMTYMVVGLNERAAILGAALPVIPILTINIRDGIRALDPKLTDMARAFRASRRQRIISIITPQIASILLASARFGIGLIWKMVLFVELLGRSDGVGYKIEYYYQLFNMTEVLAHALLFVFVMLLIELAILGNIEKALFGWRIR